MSLGGDYIYSVLNSIPELSTFDITNGALVPSTNTNMKTVNFYRITPFSGGLEYFQLQWSIDVRAASQAESEDTALIVAEYLNRITYQVGVKTYFGITDILPVIPPVNDQDAYNSSVQLFI